jgi:hypothetical protein
VERNIQLNSPVIAEKILATTRINSNFFLKVVSSPYVQSFAYVNYYSDVVGE